MSFSRNITPRFNSAAITAIIALLSLAHLIFVLPPKLIDIGALQDYAVFLPFTSAPLLVVAFRKRRSNRIILALGLIPLLVSIRVYDEVLVKCFRAELDQGRAQVELRIAPDDRKIIVLGKRDRESTYCVDDHAIELDSPITICSPHPWNREEVSLGEEFHTVTVWHSLVDDEPIVFSRIKVHPDHAPFAPAIVQLRRFSTIFRHRRGSIVLIMEGLPGLFSGATIGFYQQAWVHELFLPHHFWRSITGRFPIRLLGREVRIVAED